MTAERPSVYPVISEEGFSVGKTKPLSREKAGDCSCGSPAFAFIYGIEQAAVSAVCKECAAEILAAYWPAVSADGDGPVPGNYRPDSEELARAISLR